MAPYAERATGARRRHRRPLDRLAGRPDARPDPGRARRRDRRARLPADRRHPGAARGDRRLVRAAPRRAPGSPSTTCCRPSAPRSSWPCCRSCSASARATSVVHPRAAYPTYAIGAAIAGATRVARRRPGRVARGHAARLAEQPGQPGRPRAVGRRAAGRRDARPRAGRRHRERRVLRRARLGRAVGCRADPEHPRPAGHRRRPRGRARRLLAEQAVEPRRLPRRLRRGLRAPSSAGCSPCASTPA